MGASFNGRPAAGSEPGEVLLLEDRQARKEPLQNSNLYAPIGDFVRFLRHLLPLDKLLSCVFDP
jgi:hypothetical protein